MGGLWWPRGLAPPGVEGPHLLYPDAEPKDGFWPCRTRPRRGFGGKQDTRRNQYAQGAMKQGSNSRRGRPRSGGKRHPSSRLHSVESAGPDVKVRGSAQQVLDKYLALAQGRHFRRRPGRRGRVLPVRRPLLPFGPCRWRRLQRSRPAEPGESRSGGARARFRPRSRAPFPFPLPFPRRPRPIHSRPRPTTTRRSLDCRQKPNPKPPPLSPAAPAHRQRRCRRPESPDPGARPRGSTMRHLARPSIVPYS